MLQSVLTLYDIGMETMRESPPTSSAGPELQIPEVISGTEPNINVIHKTPDPGLGMVQTAAVIAAHSAELSLKYIYQHINGKPPPVLGSGHDLARYYELLDDSEKKLIEAAYEDRISRDDDTVDSHWVTVERVFDTERDTFVYWRYSMEQKRTHKLVGTNPPRLVDATCSALTVIGLEIRTHQRGR